MTQFRQPIVDLNQPNGVADPSVYLHTDNFYYYARKLPSNQIAVSRSRRLQDIGAAPGTIVWTPPTSGMYSTDVWAPDLRFINGTWYIYFSADDGNGYNHRMYVISCGSPQGNYGFVGQVADSTNLWAIDGSVLKDSNGALYFIWSGWATANTGSSQNQNIYIAGMSNPTTINTARTLLSSPTYSWETVGASPAVNEAPVTLYVGSSIQIIYSASGSWTDSYCLGKITYNGSGSLLNVSSWTKNSTAVFSQAPTAYGPGSCCFTQSPDKTENWIVYHANRVSGTSWGGRSIRAQLLNNTIPYMPSQPSAYNDWVNQPSGTIASIVGRLEAESGVRAGAAVVNTESAGSGTYTPSGGQVVGNMNTTADTLSFTFNCSTSGSYLLVVANANGSANGDSYHSVTVNGNSAGTIFYPKKNWQIYTVQGIYINLVAGSNTVKFTQNTNFAELDYIEIVQNF